MFDSMHQLQTAQRVARLSALRESRGVAVANMHPAIRKSSFHASKPNQAACVDAAAPPKSGCAEMSPFDPGDMSAHKDLE
jgi:hypothetical protein